MLIFDRILLDVGKIKSMRVRTDFDPKGTIFGCDIESELFTGSVDCKMSYVEGIGSASCCPESDDFNSIGDPRIVAMFLKAYYEGRESELEIMEEKEAISYLKRHVVSADIYWMATDKEPPRDGKPIFNSTPVIKLEA
jgi:hypothetical protein